MRLLLAASLVLICATASVAQAPSGQPPSSPKTSTKPYQRVALTIQILDDSRYAAFRKEVVAIARRRDAAALAAVTESTFFWDGDFGGGFEKDKPAIDNLSAALRLNAEDGSGWQRLAALADEASGGRHYQRKDVTCAPARPRHKERELERLIKATDTDGIDWAYPRGTNLAVHAAPDATSPKLDTLGLHFVRLRGYEMKDNEPAPERTAWARVETPSGRAGFVAPDSLLTLSTERLCYGKDAAGRWRIVGYVGGGD